MRPVRGSPDPPRPLLLPLLLRANDGAHVRVRVSLPPQAPQEGQEGAAAATATTAAAATATASNAARAKVK